MNARPMWMLVLVSLLACAGSALAIGVADKGNAYQCMSGNCKNGQGTLRSLYDGTDYTGPWEGGRSVPGVVYEMRHPALPNRTFHMTFAADGLYQEGSQVRALSSAVSNIYPPGVYTGTFERTTNPFLECGKPVCEVVTFHKGTYENGLGMSYTGNFAYFPIKPAYGAYIGQGVFMFVGKMEDKELGEESFGLFFSDETVAGMPIQRFTPGKPDYIAYLKKKYQFDLVKQEETNVEQQALSQKRLQFFVGTMLSLGRDAMSGKSMSDMTMNVLKSSMREDASSARWMQGVQQQVGDSLNLDENSVAATLLKGALDKAVTAKTTGGAGTRPTTTVATKSAAPARGGYRMAPFTYTCPGSPPQTIDIPYKSTSCLDARKKLAEASACNLVEQMPNAFRACEQGCASHLPDCTE